MPLDVGWRFRRGDPTDAPVATFDDSAWARVTLPHSFNAGDGEQPDYYRGPAWYRRTFTATAPDRGRRVVAEFGGAALAADVYLNGRKMGRHAGGHAGFRIDLTSALREGRNVLAVRVDNAADPAITPLGGDFTVFGGLYRDVSLIEVDPVHVDLFDHGGPGVYAHVTRMSDAAASLAVTARIANDGDAAARVLAHVRVLDEADRVVGETQLPVAIGPSGVTQAEVHLVVPHPHRWDGVRDPYLYHVEVRLGATGDRVAVPLGMREMKVDPARGFLLNGRPYPLRGVNLMHSARPGQGTAVSAREIAEDFASIREMGATSVRLVHFQHPPAAYDEADRLGLVVLTEIGINGKVAAGADFQDNAREQMRELIAQNYNHPSVAFWGIGNEVNASDATVLATLTGLRSVARLADPTRPTIYAHCCQADDAPKASISDVIGFNRYFGWYPDQKGTLGDWAAGFHAGHPGRAFAVTEYGAGASIHHHEADPTSVVPASGWHPEEYQALFHERSWRALAGKPYVFGSFVWVMFDLASGGRNEGDRPGINDKGLVTYDRRTRKDAWYWYQANWSDVPMLHLNGQRFDRRTDAKAEVKVYTNGGAVTLELNGRRVGPAMPIDHIARWRVRLVPGVNTVAVEQRRGGRTLRDTAHWTLVPSDRAIAAGPPPS